MARTTPLTLWRRQHLAFVAALLGVALSVDPRQAFADTAVPETAAAQTAMSAVVTLAGPRTITAEAADAGALSRQVKWLPAVSVANGNVTAQPDRPAGQVMRLPQVVLDRPLESSKTPLPMNVAPTRLPPVGYAQSDLAEEPESEQITQVDVTLQSPLDFSLPGGGLDIRQLAPTRFVAPLPQAIPQGRNVSRR